MQGYKAKSIEELRLEDYILDRKGPNKQLVDELHGVGRKMEKLERENSQLRDQIGNLMFDVSVKQNIIDNMSELNSSPCKLSIDTDFAQELIPDGQKRSVWKKIKTKIFQSRSGKY